MTFIIRAANEADLPAILAIYNDAVVNTTAIWNDDIVDLDNRRAWMAAARPSAIPCSSRTRRVRSSATPPSAISAPSTATASPSRTRSMSPSAARRRGVASALLAALIEQAARLGKHVMVAGIAGENEISIRLHARHGFVETARMPEVGLKFGRWLDLVFMQRTL